MRARRASRLVPLSLDWRLSPRRGSLLFEAAAGEARAGDGSDAFREDAGEGGGAGEGLVPGTYCTARLGRVCKPSPGFVSSVCQSSYCAPTDAAGKEGVCGSIKIVSEACTRKQNSCDGSTLYFAMPIGFCGVSAENRPLVLAPTTASGPCTSDSQCSSSEVCANVGSAGVCAVAAGATGTQCIPGAYVCVTAGDCPARTGLTATCSNTTCAYA